MLCSFEGIEYHRATKRTESMFNKRISVLHLEPFFLTINSVFSDLLSYIYVYIISAARCSSNLLSEHIVFY